MNDLTPEIPQLKQCAKCKEWQPATPEYFRRSPQTRSGLQYTCKKCKSVRKPSTTQPGHKRCCACGIEKPQEQFYRDKSKRDGYGSTCKECAKKQANEQHSKDLELARAKSRERHHANKEAYNRRSREYRKANAERQREYRKKNNEKRVEYNRRWLAKNGPRKERQGYQASYMLHYRHVRRARKLNLPSAFASDDAKRALGYFGNCCAVCGRPSGLFHTLAMDHWIALSSPDCPGTVPGNMIPLCHGVDGCNNQKHAKKPFDWLCAKFGKRKAAVILARIESYFATVRDG